MEWQAVHDVFIAALDIADDEREAFIARETAEQPNVAREVTRLLRLHRAAGGFLQTDPDEERLEEESLLARGELVADRFEVRRLLGRGGMAEVYEAHDRIAGEQVALKVMRSASSDPVPRAERFRQELRLARRVSHTGVCRVHDVALHRRRNGQPLLVLTMELLAGETLAERLRRGPLQPDEARSIAMAIATALDAAHAQGVLHGDVKPENVILVRRHEGSSRVVLTDFGLAQGLGAFGESSRAPGLMGTPAYMAPELLGGAPPSIASDLYAFALLTYRLLSAEDDLWRTTRALAYGRGAVPPLPGFRDLAPGEQRVLSKAVSVDPKDRYSGAMEFLRALFPLPRVRSRRVMIASTTAMLVAVVALTAGPFFHWLRVSKYENTLSAPLPLLVTVTENATKEPDLDGMTELLRAQLAQSARLEVLGSATVMQVLQEMRRDPSTPVDAPTLREVALRKHAPLVLYSRVDAAGAAYRFEVHLERVGARPSIVEEEWQQQFVARDRQQLFNAVRRASSWVRSNVGESRVELREQDRLPSEITTGSWEALRAFARAQQIHASGDSATAVVYLQEALRLDPDFVTARAWLGEVLIQLRREGDGYLELQRALELANRRQLTTREALYLRVQYAEEMGTLPEAEAAARAYALRYPNDFNATIYLGSMIAEQGRTEEAIPWLEAAARVRPASPTGHVFLAHRLITLGRFDEAGVVGGRLRATTAPDWATWMRALILFARGNLPTALETLEPLRETSDRQWRSRYHTVRASWLAEAGRFVEAERELMSGIAFDATNGIRERAALKWLHLAELRARDNDLAASADAVRKAIAVSADVRTLAIASSLFARLRMADEIRKVRDALAQHGPTVRVRLAQRRVDAELHRASGRPEPAVQTLDEIAGTMRASDYKDFYVHALIAAGRDADALALLSDWVRHPARFYWGPEPWSCGPWATAVEEYVRLLKRQANGRAAEEWEARLLDFRGRDAATHSK